MNDEEEFYEDIAASLDRFIDVPTGALRDTVARNGLCQWLYTSTDAPEWSGDDQIDRATVAGICAGCPVAAECLEHQLRSAGYATDGVWGLLAAEDRRRVFLMWLERREGGQR